MFSSRNHPGNFWAPIRATLVALGLLLVAVQASGAPPGVQPQDGYLSSDRYLSRFFGLSIVFPKELSLQPLRMAEEQGNVRWLLGLETAADQPPCRILITATEAPQKGKPGDWLREEMERQNREVDKLRAIKIGGVAFWRAEVKPRLGEEQVGSVEYMGGIEGYELRIRLGGDLGANLDALRSALEAATFLDSAEIPTKAPSGMAAYTGPAYPDLSYPTEAIAALKPGTVEGRSYKNPALGLNFQIPDGLQPRGEEMLQRDIETGHERIWENTRHARLEHDVAMACSRPLLLADEGRESSDGHAVAAVMMTALDPACLGGIHFPKSVQDGPALQMAAVAVSGQLLSKHTLNQTQGKAYARRGHIFLNVTGTFYRPEPDTKLRVVNFVRVISTELNGYWVIWAFVAPDKGSLDRLSNVQLSFYPPVGGSSKTQP